MAGYNWMDDRERQMRQRGMRDDARGTGDYRARFGEDRTWDEADRPDMYRSGGQARGGRDRVFGERETGVSYNRDPSAYRGAGQSGAYGREPARMSREDDRDETQYGSGRFYGDDGRGEIYREEYGLGGVEYGDVPRGYSSSSRYGGYGEDQERYGAGYSPTRARYHAQGYGQPGYGGYGASQGERGYGAYTDYRGGSDRPASGGTGGYDYERGYGDAGRSQMERGGDFGDRMERAGRDAGSFLRRAGERVADWFNPGGEGRPYDDLEARRRSSRGETYRGRGPQGYKRADERISEDAHERLTDDAWVDASNVSVSVSGGEVTLSGTVENREAKHRAERLVEEISGVSHVQNNLRVAKGNYFTTPSAGYGDSVLGAQIREAETDKPAAGTTNGGKKS